MDYRDSLEEIEVLKAALLRAKGTMDTILKYSIRNSLDKQLLSNEIRNIDRVLNELG